MNWGSNEWVTRIRVQEGYYHLLKYPFVLFDWTRHVEMWTNRGQHLSVGFNAGHTHEVSRPRCKLAYVTGMSGAALDFINAVWEC